MKRLSIHNPLADLGRRQEADLQSRRAATTILAPEAFEPGARKSPLKVLMTTLGGVARPITAADLKQFRRNIAAVGDKLQRGITAQDVIDHSTSADIARARKEIRHAVPTKLRNGEVIFTTPAGPESKVSRHFVQVTFVEYGKAIARPGTHLQAGTWLGREGLLKFDCDCEHFRYRLRYIATIGGYNAGRAESGFPKWTNPNLFGIACKHAIRVMTELSSSAYVRGMLARMVEADRARLDGHAKRKPRVITAVQADVNRLTQSARPRAIRTTEDQNRRVLLAGIRKAIPTGASASTRADLGQTIAALQARRDVSAAAILEALQQVLQRPASR